jgi:site-specific recombinase
MPRLSPDERRAALYDLLDDLRGGTGTSGEWLARLVAVVRPDRPGDAADAAAGVRELTFLLNARPEDAAALRRHLAGLLTTRVHRLLYADLGVTDSHGFFGDLTRRVLAELLPPAVDTDFLSDVFNEVFDRSSDHVWLDAIPAAEWKMFTRALGLGAEDFAPARARCLHELGEAIRLVSHRIAALGSDATLVRYLPALARHESPFLAQVAEVGALVDRHAGERRPRDPEDRHAEVMLGQCDRYLETVRRRSREAGVGVGLVFLISRLERALERLRLLIDLVAPALPGGATQRDGSTLPGETPPPDESAQRGDPTLPAQARDFFLRLVRQQNRRNSVAELLHGNVELIARRVTEHASRSGEHYVTETRSGLVAMFRAAAGAGFIIGVMALIKIFIAKAGLPPVWTAVGYSLNYGLGFVMIHVLHLTIATKQPAMTAATLASALDGVQGREARLDALTELAARVSRTQWVSIAGNVTVGFLTALAIAMTTTRFLGWDFVGPDKAAHLLHELRPVASLALPHAAIAGVFLFLSGLVSGYYDNQALYHRVPERLQRVRWLRRLLGEARLAKLAKYVEQNLGALVGNFLFGCMLGCTPIVGLLLGLPLDIRHVAFASANLAYGLNGVGFELRPGGIVVLVAGVLAIGFVNLAVSFTLALKTAMRSRGIERHQTQGLLLALGRRFLQRPRDFFWPRRPALDVAPGTAAASVPSH